MRLFGFLLFMSVPLAAAQSHLRVENAYIRLTPAGAPLAGYLTLINDGDVAQIVRDADADFAGMTMIHESREEDGMARMRHVDQVIVPAKGQVQFAPGGLHLMFMRPEKGLKAGDKRSVKLILQDGSVFIVEMSLQVPKISPLGLNHRACLRVCYAKIDECVGKPCRVLWPP